MFQCCNNRIEACLCPVLENITRDQCKTNLDPISLNSVLWMIKSYVNNCNIKFVSTQNNSACPEAWTGGWGFCLPKLKLSPQKFSVDPNFQVAHEASPRVLAAKPVIKS
jgi:hypothetical protein